MGSRSAAAAAILVLFGLAGCAPPPAENAADPVRRVGAIAVQSAATSAMLVVSAYSTSHMELPDSLAQAGFTPPDGITLGWTVKPSGGVT